MRGSVRGEPKEEMRGYIEWGEIKRGEGDRQWGEIERGEFWIGQARGYVLWVKLDGENEFGVALGTGPNSVFWNLELPMFIYWTFCSHVFCVGMTIGTQGLKSFVAWFLTPNFPVICIFALIELVACHIHGANLELPIVDWHQSDLAEGQGLRKPLRRTKGCYLGY